MPPPPRKSHGLFDERRTSPPIGPEDERAVDEAIRLMDPEELAARVKRALRRIYRRRYPPHYWNSLRELRELAKAIHLSRAAEVLPASVAVVNEWRMCQTEVCLRLALHLVAHDMVTSDVLVALSGREVTRYDRPTFDIATFLDEHGATSPTVLADGLGRYSTDFRHGIRIVPDEGGGDVFAALAPGSNLIVHASPGPIRETLGGIEYRILNAAIGEAVTRLDVTDLDVLAVAVPRSARMREVAEEARWAPRLVPTGLCIILVGQSDIIEGLPLLKAYEPPPFGEEQ